MIFFALIFISSATASSASSACPKICSCLDMSYGIVVDCKNKKLKDIPTSFPSNTIRLDLSDNNIEAVTVLPDLEDLVHLDLSNNKIREIKYDAFDSLESLTTLILSHNLLQSIEDDIFEWNPLKLKRIYLDHNKFEYIQHFLFYDLNDLEEIDISNNILAFIHPHAFTQLDNLVVLNLANNKLHYFQDKWVSKFASSTLNSLDVRGNPFQCDCALNDDNMVNFLTNADAKHFVEIALYNGQKSSSINCTNVGFEKKNMLKITDADRQALKCKEPKITGISKASKVNTGKSLLLKCIASGVPKPQIEWKAPNQDTYRLTSDDFEGVNVHQDGSILIEDIRHSDKGVYHCIAKNKLGTVEASTTVTVIGQDPEDTSDEWYHRDQDEWLDNANDNNEGDHVWNPIDETISGSEKEEINIIDFDTGVVVDNRNSKWDYDTCPKDCECSLEVADCSYNHLKTFPKVLPTHVTHLDMNNNDVDRIYKYVCLNYKNLNELKIDSNDVVNIADSAFDDCTKLSILTLRKNKLTEVQRKMFHGLLNLRILVLDYNFIEKINDDTFSDMPDLEFLYLRGNSIKTVEEKGFSSLPNLRFLHLEDNHIETLELAWLEEVSKNKDISRIDLSDNRFYCDSRMKVFENILSSKHSDERIQKLIQPTNLKCFKPPEFEGTAIYDIDYANLPERVAVRAPPESKTSANGGLMIAGILIGAVLTGFGIIAWRKWNRRNGMSSFHRNGLHSYQDISQTDAESRAPLTADQEAFI